MTVGIGVLARSSQARLSTVIQPTDKPAVPPMSTTTMLVLALAIKTPMYGYQLARAYRQLYESILPVSDKTILASLERLEAQEWVARRVRTHTRRSGRIVYHATLEGIVAHKR